MKSRFLAATTAAIIVVSGGVELCEGKIKGGTRVVDLVLLSACVCLYVVSYDV